MKRLEVGGILTFLDKPTAAPPLQSHKGKLRPSPYKLVFPSSRFKALSTASGAPVNLYHEFENRVGFIQNAEIKGNEVHFTGQLWARPKLEDALHKGIVGISIEVASFRNPERVGDVELMDVDFISGAGLGTQEQVAHPGAKVEIIRELPLTLSTQEEMHWMSVTSRWVNEYFSFGKMQRLYDTVAAQKS